MIKAPGGKYKFATTKENYEDYSSGRVLYGAAGATGFPVRLVSEIFQTAESFLSKDAVKQSYNIYDPFCGAGYSLTVIGLLYGGMIKNIYASDINKETLVTANKNLSLLTQQGFENRLKELKNLIKSHNKISHKDALESANHLSLKIPKIQANIFEFNILGGKTLPIPNESIDLVMADLPYGKLTSWENEDIGVNPTQVFLTNIQTILKPKSVIVISADKKQKLLHEGYKRLKILKLGKRQVLFLTKQNS